jgi:hypothetical protein
VGAESDEVDRLVPPQPDREAGGGGSGVGQCVRVSAAEAADWIKKYRGQRPVVVVAPSSSAALPIALPAPAWAQPDALRAAAGNESFRVAWVHRSRNCPGPPGAFKWP